MTDLPTLHERGPESGDVNLILELADLHDRRKEADLEARRRLMRAGFVTLIAPVNFLAHALLFWQHGWPPAGTPGFALVCLIAVFGWLSWARARLRAVAVRSYASRRRIELERGPSAVIRTSMLWSTTRP